ncbi:MAG: hypothetical protein JW986_00480 [Methanotrichaceae archaeon]|nr:hypothetical protein [Methanotrichaceae archaeon]
MQSSFVISNPNAPPVAESLSADKESPQEAGSIVTWTATASDPEDTIYYMFLVDGQPATQWQLEPVWAWDTSVVAPGEHEIQVVVRDESHDPEEIPDRSKAARFTVSEKARPEPKSISGRAYNDANGNGKDDGEAGLIGRTIEISKPDGSQATAVTDNEGRYGFDGLNPGAYSLRIVAEPGWAFSEPSDGTRSVAILDASLTDIDFGNRLSVHAISGRVYRDDGTGAATGIPGWTLTLASTEEESSATTDEEGGYVFENLPQGSYTLALAPRAGWTPTSPASGSIAATVGETDLTGMDFKVQAETYSISGRVGLEGDGRGDAGPGIWTVSIVSPDGESSTATDPEGSYRFEGLAPGGYTLGLTPRAGWTIISPPEGAHSLTIESTDVEGMDFHVQPLTYSISGRLFNDANGNGMDDGETGLSGWTVIVAGTDGESSATTDSQGSYGFQGLAPGAYTVRETVQDGWTSPGGDSRAVEIIDSNLDGVDFANRPRTFSIAGRVFSDTDASGSGEGQAGLSGWTLSLSSSAGETRSTSGDDGSYRFDGLRQGSYTLNIGSKPGWTSTVPATGSQSVDLSSDLSGIDFGVRGSFKISGTKFYDLNGNGRNDGEPGLPGWSIKLEQAGNVSAVATTDEDGRYSFENLAPGSYIASEVGREGWKVTSPAGGSHSITVRDANVESKDFGNAGDLSITGLKFYDLNANGIRDEGEPGIPGEAVELILDGRVIATTATDSQGVYTFANLAPATYSISDPPGEGLVLTTSSTVTVTLTSSVVVNQNFGLAGTYKISGTKYNDANNNKAKDGREEGIASWGMVLDGTTSGGVHLTTTAYTGAAGSYTFQNIAPGRYKVSELSREGWTPTTPTERDVNIVSSDVNGIDFGNRVVSSPTLASIWGVKFNDLNRDGARDEGEPGLSGWQIQLKNGTIVRTATTSSDGWYNISGLSPGAYTVTEVAIPTWKQTLPQWEKDYSIVLNAGETKLGVDFGNYKELPKDASLSPDKTSPQAVGTTIIWTARATGTPGETLQYLFLVNGDAKTGWTTRNQWTWSTAGLAAGKHVVEVWIKDDRHVGPNPYDIKASSEYTLSQVNRPPVVDFLYTDRSSPQYAGSWIRWTAVANDPDGDQIYYRYLKRGPSTGYTWVDMTGWTKLRSWIWRTSEYDIGRSEIRVLVRDGKHAGSGSYDDEAYGSFLILGQIIRPNQPPVLTALASNLASPRAAGSTIVWTAQASDPDAERSYFRYWLKGPSTGNAWKMVRDWNNDPSWSWTTSAKDAGQSQIRAQVRDGYHEGSSGYDDQREAYFTISIANSAPEIVSLSSDKTSPQVAGSAIQWTATARDADGDQIYYRYWLKGPSTGNAWEIARDWSKDRTWRWMTGPDDAGDYIVYLYIRDGKHASSRGYDAATGKAYELTIPPNQLPVLTGLVPDKTSPVEAGSAIGWTATSRDPDRDPVYYRYWLKGPSTGDAWEIARDWSIDPTWIWTTEIDDAGEYIVYVYIRDGKHASSRGYDGAMRNAFELTSPLARRTLADDLSLKDAPRLIRDGDGFLLAFQSWEKGQANGGDIKLIALDCDMMPEGEAWGRTSAAYQNAPSPIYSDGQCYVAYVNREGWDMDIYVDRFDENLDYIDTMRMIQPSDQDSPSLIKAGDRYYLAYQSWARGPASGGDIQIAAFDSDWRSLGAIAATPLDSYQDQPSLSSAGDRVYMAYISDQDGGQEIYVQEFDRDLNPLKVRRITSDGIDQEHPFLLWQNGAFHLAYTIGDPDGYAIVVDRFDRDWVEIDRVEIARGDEPLSWPSLAYDLSRDVYWAAYLSQVVDGWAIFAEPLSLESQVLPCDTVLSVSSTSANRPYTLTAKFYNEKGELTDPDDVSLTWSPSDSATAGSILSRISKGTYQMSSRYGVAGEKSFHMEAEIDGCFSSKDLTVSIR